MKLRKATLDDARFLFDLRNELSNRLMFANQAPVIWEDHLAWLKNKLSCNDFFLFVALDEYENRIGQFRVDAAGEVSVSVAENFKRKGIGTLIIREGSEYFRSFSTKVLIANVKSENMASLKAFQKAGYVLKNTYVQNEEEYQCFIFV